jgi:hypothetical protein
VNVWVWHGDGPQRRVLGVCARKEEAIDACEQLLTQGVVTSAAVELSWLRFDPHLTYYEHSGYGWTANWNPDTGRISWTPSDKALQTPA